MSHFFAFFARMRTILRWGLMHNTRPENLAEHSLMTAAIAHGLAVIRRDVFGGEADPGVCAAAALYHDAPEILTGDLPTPVKYFTPALRAAYSDIEEWSSARLLSLLPEELRPAYGPLLSQGGQPEAVRTLVHAADKLAAYLKCLEELRAGNAEFRDAERQTLAKLEAMAIPEVDYFLAHFAASFRLTLDELHSHKTEE